MIIRDAEQGRDIELSPAQLVRVFRVAGAVAGDRYLDDAAAERLIVSVARKIEREQPAAV